MAIKIKRDPASIKVLRGLFSSPALLGHKVWSLSDEEVAQAGERLLDSCGEAAPKIAKAFEPIGEALARLAKSFTTLNSALNNAATAKEAR